jgi:hypothetical protein
MLRMTNTDKWRDTFFYKLTPAPKLVFIYLYENCNDAGFMDLNFEQMQDLMGLGKDKLQQCMKALESRYVKNEEGTKIWLKNFLLHQGKLPLNLKTEEGRRLLNILETNSNAFEGTFIKAIIDDAFANKRRPVTPRETKVFVKPTLDEVLEHFSAQDTAYVPRAYWESIWMYYESCGWKVGSKPMVNWVAAFKGCLAREEKKSGAKIVNNIPQQPTRLDKIKEANEIKIDFNSLKNG